MRRHDPTTPGRRTPARLALTAGLALALVGAACSSGDDTDEAATADTGGSATAGTAAAAGGTATDPAGSAPGSDDEAWPIPEWSTTDAAEAGLDQATLDALATEAEAAESSCLVVTRDGRLVDEWYWGGADEDHEQEVFSASKSVSATLVGLAVDRGDLALDDPASDYIAEWRGTPSEAVTVRNLVSNDSGRYQDAVSDYVTMAVQEPDKTQYSIDLDQQHEPGTQWVYNNAAIQTLDRVLEEATGTDTAEFARTELFEPLGMDSEVATDEAGNALMFMGTQASCRDLARFGLLHLRQGRWGDEQLLSSAWVEEATSPSQDLNTSYGFLWWLNGGGTVANPDGSGVREGGIAPHAPDDMYAALGLGNQIVAVFPSSGVVAVRLGGVNRSPDAATFTVADLGAGITAALDG
jgi:CubicO group peptidase (beta-lactamase class C family)